MLFLERFETWKGSGAKINAETMVSDSLGEVSVQLRGSRVCGWNHLSERGVRVLEAPGYLKSTIQDYIITRTSHVA